MATTGKRLVQGARKVTRAIGDAVRDTKQKAKKTLGKQRRKRVIRQAGEAALAAGAALLASHAVTEVEGFVGRRIATRRSPGSLGFTVTLALDMERATARLTDMLRDEGFGIITRTDLQATFQQKLGVTFRPCLLLGVCHPALALRALTTDVEAGLLLPCSVLVEAGSDETTIVRIADPLRIFPANGPKPGELAAVARAASAGLKRVAERLAIPR